MDIARSTSIRRPSFWTLVAGVALLTASCGGEDPVAPDPDPEPQNTAPVANAGADQTVSATLPVSLDGSASADGDGDVITYSWTIASAPAGSGSALDDAAAAGPTFTPDVAGAYVIELVVSDGTEDSAADEVTITAEDNTATETIGAVGGTVMSADGKIVLEIPAGALTTDEDISITQALPGQAPSALGDLDDEAMVYDMQPDGLQFAQPVRVTVTPPESFAPEAGAEEVEVTLPVMATLSGGAFQLASAQRAIADGEAGTLSSSGEIDHFSTLVLAPTVHIGGQATRLKIVGSAPMTAEVGKFFVAGVTVSGTTALPEDPEVSAWLTDASITPVETASGTDRSDLVDASDEDGFGLVLFPSWWCVDFGIGTWAVDVEVEGFGVEFEGEIFRALDPIELKISQPVTCLQSQPPFEAFSATSPEGLNRIGTTISGEIDPTTGFVFARAGGATVTTFGGELIAQLDATELNGGSAWGASAIPDELVIVHTPTGLFVSSDPIPSSPSNPPPDLFLGPFPQPLGGPDMSDNITDALVFGGPAPGFGAVAVHHTSQNISFFAFGSTPDGAPMGTSHSGGLVFRDDLVDAFKPGGTSVFGDDLPVTAYVQPEGFDDEHPMLVASIDPISRASTIWQVELVAGVAVATEVTEVFPSDEVRQIRCLRSICAVGGYGTGFGFGGLSFFHWDGADGFTGLQGITGRTIGIDLVLSESNTVLIATTGSTGNSYLVFEFAQNGDLLNSAFETAPDGCTGPGHIAFRADDEVVITCNTSGLVVSDFFTWAG